MPRREPPTIESVGHDSFLDIVANMVGIMIILVLVVSMRIKDAPVTASIDGAESSVTSELEKDAAAEQALRKDVLAIAEQMRQLKTETSRRMLERDVLVAKSVALEHEISVRRGQLDAQRQKDFDAGRGLAEAQARLEELRRQHAETQSAPAEPVIIPSYPTPISRTVDGLEIHFQLQGDRVALIPMEVLIERFKDHARRQVYKMLDQPELTDTVGPEGGWRLRYTLRRFDISPETARETGRTGSYARMVLCTLIPTSSQLGEPVEAAMAEGSQFRAALAGHRPERTTVTLWVYPDSFAAFSQIRKELYRLGFPIAARPLPEGQPIGLSPEGSKSAAE